MFAFLKNILTAFFLILAAALLSVVYGFIASGAFTVAYIFNACFLTGAFIACVALIRMILPTGWKLDKLTDHSTFMTRSGEKHREKTEKAREFLFVGIAVIILAGLIQLLLSAVIR